MLKTPIDWSPLEMGLESYDPSFVYEVRIRTEAERLERDIAKYAGGSITAKLLTFADDSDPEDFYVRDAAMLALFESQGVLDAYYDPEHHPKAALRPHPGGWEIILAPDHFKGALTVTYQDKINDRIGQSVLRYTLPRHAALPKFGKIKSKLNSNIN